MQSIISRQSLEIYLLENHIVHLEQKNNELKSYIEMFALNESYKIKKSRFNIIKKILSCCFNNPTCN